MNLIMSKIDGNYDLNFSIPSTHYLFFIENYRVCNSN